MSCTVEKTAKRLAAPVFMILETAILRYASGAKKFHARPLSEWNLKPAASSELQAS